MSQFKAKRTKGARCPGCGARAMEFYQSVLFDAQTGRPVENWHNMDVERVWYCRAPNCDHEHRASACDPPPQARNHDGRS